MTKKISTGDSTAVSGSQLNNELTNQGASATGDNPITVTFDSGNIYTINTNGDIEKYEPPQPMVSGKTVKESKGNKVATSNTELVDDYGNKITIPKGFKISTDSADNVTGGIVIEDVNAGTTETIGSQFVWIPVGNIYTDTNNSITNIELCRCGFNQNGEKVSVEDGWEYQCSLMKNNMPNGMPDQAKDSTINIYKAYTFSEEDTSRIGSYPIQNSTAKNLTNFLSKASKGYYIGRFEARTTEQRTSSGDATTVVTEKTGDFVYNYVTQLQASERSRNMYTSSSFESDLINSYAWDTAILFLQAFDDRTNTNTKYSLQTSLNNSISTTGTTVDVICNIYDMASNCNEWTTETCNCGTSYSPCVIRGRRI